MSDRSISGGKTGGGYLYLDKRSHVQRHGGVEVCTPHVGCLSWAGSFVFPTCFGLFFSSGPTPVRKARRGERTCTGTRPEVPRAETRAYHYLACAFSARTRTYLYLRRNPSVTRAVGPCQPRLCKRAAAFDRGASACASPAVLFLPRPVPCWMRRGRQAAITKHLACLPRQRAPTPVAVRRPLLGT